MPPRPGPFYQDYYKDDKEGRIALLNCLAAYNTTIAARSKSKPVCVRVICVGYVRGPWPLLMNECVLLPVSCYRQVKESSLARAIELYQQVLSHSPYATSRSQAAGKHTEVCGQTYCNMKPPAMHAELLCLSIVTISLRRQWCPTATTVSRKHVCDTLL